MQTQLDRIMTSNPFKNWPRATNIQWTTMQWGSGDQTHSCWMFFLFGIYPPLKMQRWEMKWFFKIPSEAFSLTDKCSHMVEIQKPARKEELKCSLLWLASIQTKIEIPDNIAFAGHEIVILTCLCHEWFDYLNQNNLFVLFP